MEHNVPIIVIDLDARVVNRCQQLGHYAIHGSCDSQPVLQAARVKSARLMVISTGYPVSSLVTAQVALQLNPELDVVARIHWRKEGDQFQRIGVKEVVWPEMEGGWKSSDIPFIGAASNRAKSYRPCQRAGAPRRGIPPISYSILRPQRLQLLE